MHREECLNQTRKADVWNCCATAETHTVAQRYKWVCLCSSVESGWYSTLICREQSFSFTTFGMLENESLLKQSANRVLFLTSKLWRQFQMAEQTQRVACANLAEVCKAPEGILLPGTPCCFVTIQTSLPQAFLWHGGRKKRKDRPRLQHTVFYLSKSLSWVHSNNFDLKVPRQLQAGGCKYRHVHCVHSLYDFLFLCVSVTAASPRNCLKKHSLVTSIPGPEKPDITKIWCKLDGLDKF